MRTLVIAGDYPWPENIGPRMRLAMVLRGLAACGPTELFSVVSRLRTEFAPVEEGLDLHRVGRVGFDNLPRTGLGLLPTLVRPSMPLTMPWHDRDQVQRALAEFVTGPYDLVWFFGVRPWVLAGEPGLAPTVLDLDDLEDQKIAARLSMPSRRPPTAMARLRGAAADAVSREEIRRWRRLHRRAASRVASVVVCSALDADRAASQGVARVEVIPNAYRLVGPPVGRASVGLPPTVLFQGLLRYPPNAEAAITLADEVGPALRRLVPDATIRLVGEHQAALAVLHDPPRVTVVGRVPDMTAELARADVVVVPIRYGSGTRLKIIEAFAHRIPVVSTTLGAEGLGAEDGVHLLIGDTVASLAEACTRVLQDGDLRRTLVERAHALYLECLSSEVVEAQVARVARAAVQGVGA